MTAVVVVGAGLVGASIGCALTAKGRRVHLVDSQASHAVVAAGRGAGVVEPAVADQVELVVVAVPPNSIADAVAAALSDFPRAVVTDVGSVKGAVLTELVRRGLDISRYVGSHPMAGSQHSGPVTASSNLFVDRTWVVCPHPSNSAATVAVVAAMAESCGAIVVKMDAAEHDRAVARVSHLPQLVSTLTAGRLTEVPAGHVRLAGQGLRDVTRIAGSDPELWTQIVEANAEALREELTAVHAALGQLIRGLHDPAVVRDFLDRGRTGTRALPGKHGTAASQFDHVVLEIPDAPGALARLFADVEKAGVNVEDVSIEHDPAREVGWLSVGVAPERAEELAAAMQAAGWAVRP